VRVIELIAGGVLAGTVAGASGFGAALVLQPLLLAVYSPATALVALTVASCGVNGSVWRAGRLRRDLLRPLLFAAPVGAVAGVAVFTQFDKQALQVLLGCAVITGSLAIASRGRARALLTRAPLPLWGAISGALTTSVGTNGPPVVIGLAGHELDPHEQRGTLAAYFLCSTPLTLATIFAAHKAGSLLPGAELGLALLPATALGVLAGGRLAQRFHRDRFRALTITLVFAAGCASLVAGIA
jgi:uncharacterized protein